MMTLGEMTLEDAAREAAGNWKQFDCFVWDRERDLDDADQWAIFYSHPRDSGLLDLSNADAMAKELGPFTEGDDPDVMFETHNHWAVGHVDGFSAVSTGTARSPTPSRPTTTWPSGSPTIQSSTKRTIAAVSAWPRSRTSPKRRGR